MATEYDMSQVVRAIRSLPGDEGRETTLCLLSMLLPFQMRLHGLARQDEASVELQQLDKDLFDWFVAIRDRLLEEDVASAPARVTPNGLKRVLLVEDDEAWRNKFLQLLCRLAGWEIVIAISHDDLAAQLTSGQFGVLMLDEFLWEQKRVYEHAAAIKVQVAGGARVFSLSSSGEAAADMAKCFGTEVSAAWGKRNMRSASSTELVSAIEG